MLIVLSEIVNFRLEWVDCIMQLFKSVVRTEIFKQFGRDFVKNKEVVEKKFEDHEQNIC
jgi:hypothetical protein